MSGSHHRSSVLFLLMASPPAIERTYPAGVDCPQCGYTLDGLPRQTPVCPECGGELSSAAFARGAAKRMLRNTMARLVLLVSPAIGLLAGGVVFAIHRGSYAALVVLLSCLWLGASIAAYYSTGRPGSRRPVRALLVGLPLGVAYFVGVVAAAAGIVLLIVWIGQ